MQNIVVAIRVEYPYAVAFSPAAPQMDRWDSECLSLWYDHRNPRWRPVYDSRSRVRDSEDDICWLRFEELGKSTLRWFVRLAPASVFCFEHWQTAQVPAALKLTV